MIQIINQLNLRLSLLALITSTSLSGQFYEKSVREQEVAPQFNILSSTTFQSTPTMDTLQINLQLFKQDHWTQEETENVRLVADFIQHLMMDHDFDYIMATYGKNPYVQHNRTIPDGIEGLVENLKGIVKRFPEYTYDVKRINVDGNYVTFHSHATMKIKDRGNDQRGFNITDTWRIDKGQIVEHWDSVEAIDKGMRFFVWMNGGKVRNANGVF
ncbi:MAG: nuclear transport factor 2 family protein [Bacteroidota bacterium]